MTVRELIEELEKVRNKNEEVSFFTQTKYPRVDALPVHGVMRSEGGPGVVFYSNGADYYVWRYDGI